MTRYRWLLRTAVGGLVFCAVGFGSTLLTARHLQKSFVSKVENNMVTKDVKELNFGWIEPNRLTQRALWEGIRPVHYGVIGSLLNPDYVLVPDKQTWASHSRGGGFAWGYFKRHATFPFVAIIDSGVTIMYPPQADGQQYGQYGHYRDLYVCAFGFGASLGTWHTGAQI